jgi:hypothetical protein
VRSSQASRSFSVPAAHRPTEARITSSVQINLSATPDCPYSSHAFLSLCPAASPRASLIKAFGGFPCAFVIGIRLPLRPCRSLSPSVRSASRNALSRPATLGSRPRTGGARRVVRSGIPRGRRRLANCGDGRLRSAEADATG